MKKFCAVLLAAMFSFSCVSAGDFKDYTHWSVAVHGGISQFDGDAVQDYNQMFSASHILWIVGVEGEYTWNPYWGLVAQFEYIPYMGKTSGSYGKNTFKGWSCDPSLMVSVNVLNLFGQYRKDWHWGLYLKAGVGMSFYGVDSQVTEGEEAYGKDPVPFNDGRCIMFPFGVDLEYNINKWLAVNLSGSYRMHNKDNFEGEDYTRGTSNDAIFTVTAGLRVKLAPNKKNGHVRNTSMYDYHQHMLGNNDYQAAIDSLNDRVSNLNERVSNLEDSLYNTVLPQMDDRANELERRVEDLADLSSQCCQRVADRLDTLETIVHKVYVNDGERVTEYPAAEDSIYFPLGKYYLTIQAKQKLNEVVKTLKENPSWKVVVVGYTDAPGDPVYNQQMSQNRVDVAERHLIKAGVEKARIITESRGAISEPPTFSQSNRRCDIIYLKPEGDAKAE